MSDKPPETAPLTSVEVANEEIRKLKEDRRDLFRSIEILGEDVARFNEAYKIGQRLLRELVEAHDTGWCERDGKRCHECLWCQAKTFSELE